MGSLLETRDPREPRVGRLTQWLDAAISAVSPKLGAERRAWRELSSSWNRFMRDRLSTIKAMGPSLSADEEIELDRMGWIETARQLEDRYEIAEHVLNTSTRNVVGPAGMRPQARSGSAAWNRRAEALWKEWARSSAHSRGTLTFGSLQKLAFRARLRDGDVAAIKIRDGSLQLVEADLIDSPLRSKTRTPEGHTIVEGVELDAKRRPVRYHVRTTSSRTTPDFKPVPAENVVFTARRRRADQTRGRPLLARPVLFEQLMGYIEALVVASRMAACFGLIIKRGRRLDPAKLPTVTSRRGESTPAYRFEPGTVGEIGPEDSMEQVSPGQPTQQFGELVRAVSRLIGLPAGFPLELVLLDFSQSNFSAARGAMLEARSEFRTLQQDFIDEFLSPIYQWRIDEWIRQGALDPRVDAHEHAWQRPAFPYIDPVKEVEADGLAVAFGFKTRRDVVAQQGEDWEETFEQLAREERHAEDLGLRFQHPSKTRAHGEAGSEDDSESSEPEEEGSEE